MQEEATQRVREMQRRAQLTAQRAQEELDRKKANLPPFQRRRRGPCRQKPQSTAPIGSRSTCQQGSRPQRKKTEVDADRLAFLDNKPQHSQPPAGKPRSPKHISLPVDYIQEKRETPLPVQEEEPHASQGAVPGKRPLPLGLAEGSSDQSLLLALMLLLNGEGADELLLLALLYIMM